MSRSHSSASVRLTKQPLSHPAGYQEAVTLLSQRPCTRCHLKATVTCSCEQSLTGAEIFKMGGPADDHWGPSVDGEHLKDGGVEESVNSVQASRVAT